MGKQLTLGELKKALEELSKKHDDNTIVFIGEDDELNGIHMAWYCEDIDNIEFADLMTSRVVFDKAILIS